MNKNAAFKSYNMMTGNSPKVAGYKAPAVCKAFQLLHLVADARHGMRLSEMAHKLGFSKSTTHGLIQALVKEGALEQSPQAKTFFLGPAIVDLAFKSWNYFRVIEKAQPSLETLRDRIGETVFLGVLSRSGGIIMATAEAAKPIKISSPPGATIPLLAGAVGKVFLAHLDDAQTLKHIREKGLPSFTPRSITSEKAYLAELAQVRKNGYALDNEEYLPGVKAVAVSLGNQRGLPLAIWVVGFAGDMGKSVMSGIVQSVLQTAQQLRSILDNS